VEDAGVDWQGAGLRIEFLHEFGSDTFGRFRSLWRRDLLVPARASAGPDDLLVAGVA
jgi:hypothetical protein